MPITITAPIKPRSIRARVTPFARIIVGMRGRTGPAIIIVVTRMRGTMVSTRDTAVRLVHVV